MAYIPPIIMLLSGSLAYLFVKRKKALSFNNADRHCDCIFRYIHGVYLGLFSG